MMGWISAAKALELLGIKPQTLYANVSRGRIAARPDPDDPRRSLYRQEDVERLAGRRQGRRPAQEVAAESIAWGEPVLTTAISTVQDGRLLYRGVDAARLAEGATLEEVAGLLWQAPVQDFTSAGKARQPGIAAAYRAIAELAAADLPTLGRARAILLADAARVVSHLAGAFTAQRDGPVHQRLAARWGHPEAGEAVRRALVALAEHELNASTFAARVAASTGAPIAAAVMAGLAALSGPLHGSASSAMRALLGEARRDGAEEAIRAHLRHGRALPCFGHRLHTAGDVRVQPILIALPLPQLFTELAEAAERISGEKPNVDFALAAMVEAFDLPDEAPLEIFALARSVGWIAHALEQVETGALIRPRARYVGP